MDSTGAGNVFGPEKTRLKIRMDLPYDSFSDDLKASYLSDLAKLAGCPPAAIQKTVFLRSCVIHEFEVPKPVADRLLELWTRLKNDKSLDPDDKEALEAFLDAWKIDRIAAYETVRVQVLRDEPKRATIFVHGWRGESTSFGHLPQWLEEQTGWHSRVYPYPTGLWSHSPSIVMVSRALENWVRGNFPDSQLAFVAHSMGGAVVRHVLTSQDVRDRPIDGRIPLVVLCASPENGGALAAVAAHVPTLRSAQIVELSPNSGFLLDLNTRWDVWVRRNVPARSRVRSIFGTKDAVVTANNARGVDTEPVPILGAGHIDIVKPSAADSDIVMTIGRWIKEVENETAVASSA